MDIDKIKTVHSWLCNIINNLFRMPIIHPQDILKVNNKLFEIIYDIRQEFPFFSQELTTIKDNLFTNNKINLTVCGQCIEILRVLQNVENQEKADIWRLVHPRIISVSKQLFEDGHYANAAADAFIEINDRVKKLFLKVKPDETKIPDGHALMTTVFSENKPLIEICNQTTDSGKNTQKGYMHMLAGALSALRNPRVHANVSISAEEAMRELMFASMLMYKIDEAVLYSKINE
ncbi:TIGR02391 family protein [uncultured Desulfovibrio sp.]|uniref:TIGR02391 family protein n=1 Tax=uncultured Desulfovibrio sp. TaxID=167968 RepID=UPI002611052D|nr:TIGR02391 family protein [uncultured Desulfovibrio sp.]